MGRDSRDDDGRAGDAPGAGPPQAEPRARRRRRWSFGRRLRWIVRREWERDRLQLTGPDRTAKVTTAVILGAFVATAVPAP